MAGTRPASRLERFDVTAPAGTVATAAIEVPTSWLPGELVGVLLDIPDGHNGLTGIQLALAHQPVIPRTAGAWIIGNDEHLELDTIGYLNTGAWSAFVYNTDIFDHAFHVTFLVADFAFSTTPPQPAPIATPAIV